MKIDREELYEELLDLSKTELVNEVLDLMEDRVPKFERVIAVRCCGVYKDYDGNAPDTNYFLYTMNVKLAREACDLLNEDDGGCAVSEGHEWAASWKFRKTILENEDGIAFNSESVDKAVEDLRDE